MKALRTSVALTIALSLTGCFKLSAEEQKKAEEQLASALASAMQAPPSSAAPSTSGAAAAAAGTPGTVTATCNNKGDGKCTEVMGAEGLGADESCTRLGGVYAKGSTPCPREHIVGTCARTDKDSSLNDLDYYYKQEGQDAATLKSLCEGVMSGTWAAPTAAPAAAPATKGPPAAKATPAKAAPAKKK